jgi:hypothetical protein
MDVRRLAAADMYGRLGNRRRRRLILAEFTLAAIDIPVLGLAILRAASSPLRVPLGAYLIGVGLNHVPLALHAISLSRAGRLDAELSGVVSGQSRGDTPPNGSSLPSRYWYWSSAPCSSL